MNSNTLAAGVVGFLLGGLTVSIAAELETTTTPNPRTAPAITKAPNDQTPRWRGLPTIGQPESGRTEQRRTWHVTIRQPSRASRVCSAA